MDNRLLRNEHDKVIAGVSSGLASYMEVDVTIIRLLFVLSTIFLVGTGILVYLVMWIVVPVNNDPAAKFSKFNDYFKHTPNAGFNTPPVPPAQEPNPYVKKEEWTQARADAQFGSAWQNPVDFKTLPKNSGTGRTVGGLFLLVIGMYFLMNEFDIIPYWFRLSKLWPLVFVAIGLSFILKSKRKNNWEDWKREQELRTEQDFKAEQEPKTEQQVKTETGVKTDTAVKTDEGIKDDQENKDQENKDQV